VSEDRLVIGWIHNDTCSALFAKSLYSSLIYDLAREQRIAGIIDEYSSANVSTARNNVVRQFLADHDAAWLLFIDADMVWEAEAPLRLLAAADEDDTPILGALCHGAIHDELFSTIFVIAEHEGATKMQRLRDYPDGGGIGKCSATGAAFLLVHRSVLAKVEAQHFDEAFPWFQETSIGRAPVSEDVTFCLRAGRLGIPVHVHTGVEAGHHKSTVLTKAKLREQQRLTAVLADA
jgi:GT2 family glycosyltransferase